MKRRSAMALLEVLGALVLIGVFTIVSAELFSAMMKIAATARDQPRPDRRRQQLVDRLREDVWSAVELRIVDNRELILRLTGDRSIFWKLAADGAALRRTELVATRRQGEESWNTTTGSLPREFRSAGPGVRIIWPDAVAADGGIVDLYSMLISLSGGRP